jgi:hypothetical protein
MRQRTCFVIVVLLVAGCEDTYYEPLQPHDSARLRGRSSMVPQWPMFHHDARHTGNVNTPVFDVVGSRRDTIAIAWRTPIDNPIDSSPAVGRDGTIYFGTRSINNPDSCTFYAINNDGSIRWRYGPVGSVWSSPAIGDDGTVYVGAKSGFYAFTSSGQLKWKNSGPWSITSSPAIGKDGTVYYVSDHLNAVEPSDGSTKWQVVGGDAQNSPSISSDGTIYYSYQGAIKAVTSTGTVKWQFKDTSETPMVLSIEIGYDGTIFYVGYGSPNLFAVSPQGTLLWKAKVAPGIDPCLSPEGQILVASQAYWRLRCVESDGELKWETPLPAPVGSLQAPLTIDANSIVYIGLSDNMSGSAVVAYNKANLLWQFGAHDADNGGGVRAAPAIFNGSVYFAWAYGPPYVYSLH